MALDNLDKPYIIESGGKDSSYQTFVYIRPYRTLSNPHYPEGWREFIESRITTPPKPLYPFVHPRSKPARSSP